MFVAQDTSRVPTSGMTLPPGYSVWGRVNLTNQFPWFFLTFEDQRLPAPAVQTVLFASAQNVQQAIQDLGVSIKQLGVMILDRAHGSWVPEIIKEVWHSTSPELDSPSSLLFKTSRSTWCDEFGMDARSDANSKDTLTRIY